MAKRGADNYLTDQNCDQEYVPEESGTFTPADQDVLKGRVIKKAKRRGNQDAAGSGGAGVFSGFGGLKSNTAAPSTGFSFGAKTGFSFGVKKTEEQEDTNGNEIKGGFTGFSFKKSNIESSGNEGFKGFNLMPKQSEKPDTEASKTVDSSNGKETGFKEFGGFSTSANPTTSSAGGFQGFNIAKAKPEEDNKQPEDKQLVSQSVDSVLKGNKLFSTSQSTILTTSTNDSTTTTSQSTGFAFKMAKPAAINSDTNENKGSESSFKAFGAPSKTNTDNKAKVSITNTPASGSGLLFGKKMEEKQTEKTQEKDITDIEITSKPSTDKEESAEYGRQLSALNKCVSKWIGEHVDQDSICDLTPIFTDYQKYFKEITQKFGSESLLSSENDNLKSSTITIPQSSNFLVSSTSQSPLSPKNPEKVGLFGAKQSPKSTPLFGGKNLPSQSNQPKAPLFKGFDTGGGNFQGFSERKPAEGGFGGFKFNSNMTSNSTQQQQASAGSTDDYVPPKNESEIVEEKDAFYTKKCKLFYMKQGNYVDKGVGHIHLKPVPDSQKTQLIIRADTSLGNVLLNIVINSAMPVKKQGKNNVAFSCVSNPPVDEENPSKVVSMLVRVKSSEDAEDLLKIIEQKKNEAE